tara:strand:- start:3390 stop:4121 length:732 start_codon:yes stop_codon:yes gene_type:complete
MTLIKHTSQKATKLYQLSYNQEKILIKVRKNKLSKSYKLTFDKKDLCGLVSIPRHISYKDGLKFADENLKWLISQIEQFDPIIIIKDNIKINFAGEEKIIKFINSKKVKVEDNKKEITIYCKEGSHSKVLFKWIKNQILIHSNIIIERLSKKLSVKINKVKITNSFSYWGSCNSKNEISINWRLIFCPEKILEYIIAHELCHLLEFNHSKKFWKLVDSIIDKRLDSQKWLKKNDNYMYRIRMN